MIPIAVMIHGAGGGGWEFVFWRRVFRRHGFVCIAPTLMPNPAGIASTTLNDYIDQTAPACSGMSVDCLIGASLGGTIALSLLDVVRPKRLILINSNLPARLQPQPLPTWPEVIRWSHGSVDDSKEAMPGATDSVVRAAACRWRDESGQVLAEAARRLTTLEIPVPHLMVISGADASVPPEGSLTWAKASGASVRYFAGLSHIDPLLGVQSHFVADLCAGWAHLPPV